MANIHEDPAAFKSLQDDIYRERILRARAMTPEERFDSALEMTNFVFGNMLAGAMWQLGTQDQGEGWNEVRRRLDRLYRVRDQGRFVNEKPCET